MVTLNSIMALHSTMALHSLISFAHCRAASTVVPLLPKAIFTPCIQTNLGLPSTRPPLTPAVNTLLVIQYSSILSTCPKHPILSDQLYSPTQILYIPLLRTSSFLTLSSRDTLTKLLNTSTQERSLSFSRNFSYPMPLLCTTPLVQLLHHMDIFFASIPNPLLYSTFSVLQTLYTPHSFRVSHSFHNFNLLPLATPGT